MRTSNRLFLSAGLFIAFLSPACSDSTGTSDESAVRVTLSGDQTGQFVVSGSVSGDPFALVGSGRDVLGHYFIEAEGSFPEAVEMVAMRHTADGNVDILILWGPSHSGIQAVTEDFTVVLALGVPIGTDGALDWDAFDSAYTIEDGTINVQQIASNVYKGTFSGTAYEWRSGAELRMLNGTFDISGQGSAGLSTSLCKISGSC
jgi:hypothetical protein